MAVDGEIGKNNTKRVGACAAPVMSFGFRFQFLLISIFPLLSWLPPYYFRFKFLI
jgi:hypothetical protein